MPINSNKHIRQIPVDATMGGTIANIPIAIAAAVPTGNDVDVREGAEIKAVFCELWVMANAQNIGSITLTIEKLVAGQTPMTFVQSAQLDAYPNKKNIFYTTQGLTGENDTNPIPFIRMWVKIPKGKQRFGLGDSLYANLSANLEDAQHCGVFVYKERF